MSRPIVVLSSGGKDSLYMLERLRCDPQWQVVTLVTTVNQANGRVAMHGTPASLMRAQANSLGVPLQLADLPPDCDNAEYEQRLADVLEPWSDQGVTDIACGDLFLDDLRHWREQLFERLGWQPRFPLWHEPTDQLAQRMIEEGWRLTLTCVDTQCLGTEFLGRSFDRQLLADLPAGVDPCGENGEFHSFVHDGPGFSRPVRFGTGRTVMSHDRYAMLELVADETVG